MGGVKKKPGPLHSEKRVKEGNFGPDTTGVVGGGSPAKKRSKRQTGEGSGSLEIRGEKVTTTDKKVLCREPAVLSRKKKGGERGK